MSPDERGESVPSEATSTPKPPEAKSGSSPLEAKSGPAPLVAKSGPAPLEAKSGPAPLEAKSGPAPLEAKSGPAPLEAKTGPRPLEAKSGPAPLEAKSGPAPLEAKSGPAPLEAKTGPRPLEAKSGPAPLEAKSGSTPRHPDGELLDAYADGERTPGSVDRHIRGCAACQQTVVALRGVRVELARLAPISMPPDVARRIQEALTAAPLPVAPTPPGARRGGAADRRAGARRSAERRRRPMATHGVTPLRPPDRSTLARSARPERLVFMAVCLLVVVAGGGLIVALQHRTSPSSGTASVAAPEVSQDLKISADSAAGAAAPTPAATEGMVTLASSGSVQSFRVATSRVPLGPDGVAQHARDLLAGRVPVAGAVPLTASAAAAAGSWAAVATPALLACYRQLVDTAHGPLLAVDEVSYRGRDAVLVVLDIPDGAQAVSGASAAPDAALVPASEDRIQLTVVDVGCEVAQLPAATLFAEESTKAA